jgi:cell division protein FtsB
MKKRVNPLSNYKLVYRPAKPVLKITLLATLVACTTAMVITGVSISRNRAKVAASEDQQQALIAEQQDLQDKIDKHGTKDGLKDYAEEELGMVDKDTVIFESGN